MTIRSKASSYLSHVGMTGGSLAAVAAMLACASPAFAQATTPEGQPQAAPAVNQPIQPAPAPAAATQDEAAPPAGAEVTVTGTRVRSGFQAPTPTTVVGAADLQTRGASSVTTLLQELPAINSSRSNAASNGVRTQTPGQNFADLRGLGTQRTLVLVDGHRFVPTVPGSSTGSPYQVDLNLIPTMMIDHVDIVTGGASAQWGSDAVAGVLNFVLKKKVNGLQGEVQTGVSQYGDYVEYRVALLGGFSFGGDRGHVVVSGDWVKNNGIDTYRDRTWSARQCNLFADPSSTVANGQPKQVIACDTQNGNRTAGGLITSSTNGTAANRLALVGLQFDSATAVSPFVRGGYNPAGVTTTATSTSGVFSATQSGGNNPNQEITSMFVPLERKNVFGRAEYALTDSITINIAGSWGKSGARQVNRQTRDQSGVYNPTTGTGSQIRLYADNPFIPASIRAFIPAPAGPASATTPTALQSIVIARDDYDYPNGITVLSDEAYTASAGLEGDFGHGFGWDASFIHGQNIYQRQTFNTRDRVAYAQAVDAVTSPTGQIVCRVALTNPNTACVPLNTFGQGTPNPAAFNYFEFTAYGHVKYVQDAAQLNFHGSPFSTWAGPVAMAAGFEWRKESVDSTVGARDALNVADSSVGAPFAGTFNVKEGYFEATVPLAEDMAFAKSLALNGAVRYADYSNFGGNTTWKVGATYEPFAGLLLRTTLSRDVRAPALYELYVPAVTSNQNIIYNGRQFTGVSIANIGNPALKPERSNTFTVGGSFTPRFFSGFQLSVDYFHIKVNDVITTLGPVAIARNCDNGLTAFCPLLGLDGAGNLLSVRDQFLNLSSYLTTGLDFALSYRTPLFNGTFSVRGNATYVDKFEIVAPGSPPVVAEYAGQNSTQQFAIPHWKGNVTVGYQQDPFGINLQARYVGPGRQDTNLIETATATSQPDISYATNHIPSYVVFNLGGTVDVLRDHRGQFFFTVENLFNRDPLLVPSVSTGIQTNGALYDVIGRYFRFGFRFKI